MRKRDADAPEPQPEPQPQPRLEPEELQPEEEQLGFAPLGYKTPLSLMGMVGATPSPRPTTIDQVHEQMDELRDFLGAKMKAMDSREYMGRRVLEEVVVPVEKAVAQPAEARELVEADLGAGYRARRAAHGLIEPDGDEADPETLALEPESALPEGSPPASSRPRTGHAALLQERLYPECDSPAERARQRLPETVLSQNVHWKGQPRLEIIVVKRGRVWKRYRYLSFGTRWRAGRGSAFRSAGTAAYRNGPSRVITPPTRR